MSGRAHLRRGLECGSCGQFFTSPTTSKNSSISGLLNMSDLGFYICKECEELQVRQFAELEEIQFDHDQSNTFEEPPVTAPKATKSKSAKRQRKPSDLNSKSDDMPNRKVTAVWSSETYLRNLSQDDSRMNESEDLSRSNVVDGLFTSRTHSFLKFVSDKCERETKFSESNINDKQNENGDKQSLRRKQFRKPEAPKRLNVS